MSSEKSNLKGLIKMINDAFTLISVISGNGSKIFIGLGLIFLLVKLVEKVFHNNIIGGVLRKIKFPTYILHKMFAIAVILAVIHAFSINLENQSAVILGWVTVGVMIILMALGIKMGFDNNWVPFDEEKDRKWKKIRLMKWVLTFCMIGFLGLHFFVQG